ncbi:VirD4-like conjugal transfer protein, CD1115 family [Tetragenococcus halophilus]|uniref:VirD4-like conjugal transfer protein, CD1115 family n=1 Tax=Tetragenococcus halophilus TaxID=51669 RepID=UPI00256312F2|nr:type IV secretory system conjugative DNA transfer family protein [Tetragenococcus halophilus]GMG66722.1 type IV secretory system conjugative DNA transfer family protein [Tetragenococcus halophilus]
MNKEFKQWKKVLASPYFLGSAGFLLGLGSLLLLNFIFNGLNAMHGFVPRLKNYILEGTKFPIQIRWLWLKIPVFTTQIALIIYIVCFIFFLIFILKKLYDVFNAYKDINHFVKGSERFTTKKELDQQYKKVPLDDQEYPGDSGIPVASAIETKEIQGKKIQQKVVYIDTKNTNSLTVGGTQSGKTSLFSYPFLDLIMRAKEKDTVIVNDLKGDMLKNTQQAFKSWGYDVYCLNLIEPENGIRYNPLDLVKQAYFAGDTTKAQMLASSLSFSLYHNPNAKEPMWEEASISLLNALVLAICEKGQNESKPEIVNMYAVTSMLEELGAYPDEDGTTDLDRYFDQLPTTSVARKQYGTIKFSQGITRSGIFTTTMAKLKNYTYDAIAKLTSESDFQLADLGYGDCPIALFIVYPDWNDSNYSIISTFLSQINEVLSEQATLTGVGTKRRVRYLLEEAANIPAIDGLSRAMNVGLQRHLIYHLVVQSYAQLDDKYGEKLSKAITGACGNQIYIMSDEYGDADYFAKKLGEQTVITGDRHGDPMSQDKSYGEKEEGRQLLFANELRDLQEGEWVLDRTKMRRDLKGNKVRPYPIFANLKEGTDMTFHFDYLLPRFKGERNLNQMDLGKENHKSIQLKDFIVTDWKMKSVQQASHKQLLSSEEKKQQLKEKFYQMDPVRPEIASDQLLKEQLGYKKFLPFVKAAHDDQLTVEQNERLNQLTSLVELQNFCHTKNRPHLLQAYEQFCSETEPL